MRIGLVIYGSLDTLSGGYFYDRKLVESLRATGDTVEVISLPWRSYFAHLTDNISLRLPRGLDLVIEDELNHPSLLAANRRPHPYPIISLIHHLRCSEQRPGWQNQFYRIIERKYLRSVDGFIFNSKTTQEVVHTLAGDDKPGVLAYPPTDRFGNGLPIAFVAARAAESTPLQIIFLGNLIPRKGLHTLLDAVRCADVPIHVDVVGNLNSDPTYTSAMKKRASVQVTFHGALDNAPLVEKLKNAHLLVVPSSYEGFGIVYLEGMAFGLPAIGTTAGAASEIIQHGKTGYLIAPDDSRTLAEHLSTLAADRALLAEMSVNALERYKEQPAWHETTGKIRAFLRQMAY